MPSRLEDYALIGDCHTAALVGRDGSMDWLCLPRFDSPACFAALLGQSEHGRWQLAPVGEHKSIRRRYRGDTLILETEFDADGGTVRLIDFMPVLQSHADVVRVVEGVRGRVRRRMELVIRFDYGASVPWVRRHGDELSAIAGPDRMRLVTPVRLEGRDFRTFAEFEVDEGQRVPFDLTWFPSHLEPPPRLDCVESLHATERWWAEWSSCCAYDGEWKEAVQRSLITLKALTYAPTGGLVAAPTTSLPEHLGGVRNWDYRYCWLRDATFTLYALSSGGYHEEARAWHDWLLRAAAGFPSQLQIMYGLAGERRLQEQELPWLPGYEGSAPVRIGNAAWSQFQLDVFGEVMDAMHRGRRSGMNSGEEAWKLESALIRYLETVWLEPDEGIWEVRGPRRHFTHSKVMTWVAFDRAVKAVEQFGLPGPVEGWRRIREEIHQEVCRQGYDPNLGSFVQSYGSTSLDASLLMIPLVGFLPPTDPRVQGTVRAIEKDLTRNGFVERYRTDPDVDGLPHGEGSFLLCTFWLADNLELQGRHEEARAIFNRLLSIRGDVGLLSECYDVSSGRLVGNFPQAFSHVGLINTARNLSRKDGPAQDRPHS